MLFRRIASCSYSMVYPQLYSDDEGPCIPLKRLALGLFRIRNSAVKGLGFKVQGFSVWASRCREVHGGCQNQMI